MPKNARYAVIEGAGSWTGKLYFFIDNQYSRYDIDADRIDDGFPQPITAWNFPSGFVSGLDAALNGRGPYGGKAYFFKDGQYLRYDWASNSVDDGYPAAVDAWHLPADFQNGIDAALNGVGQYDGKAYFFKNSSFVRYDWASDRVDDGYPQPISAWNLPGSLSQQLDAACNAPSNYTPEDGSGKYRGKAWFFKGRQYARYDWATNRADPGFPADIAAWGLPGGGLAWGKRVSADFKGKVAATATALGCDPNHLMAAMAFETGETFSPSIVNHVSGATGLIQFMPATAKSLGTTTADLAAMPAEQQLDYVAKYFSPYKGRLSALSDVYMVILWPKAVGQGEDYVLFASPSIQYQQNKGLDTDQDGSVTKKEAAAAVQAKLVKGMGAGYFG